MFYFFLFILGLAVGSFLNVISLRYLPGQRLLSRNIVRGRSHCPSCQKKLDWYELIPILSFIIQKGRCRSCGTRLFWQYPVVEILSGLIFVFVPLIIFQSFPPEADPPSADNLSIFQSLIWILIFSLFLLLSIIDFRHYIIPDSINLSLAILGIVLIFLRKSFNLSFLGHYSPLFNFWPLSIANSQWSIVVNHLAAALFGMLFFGVIIILSRGKAMGWGDLKLTGALGLIFGWPDVIMILMLSFLVGGIFSVVLLIKGKKKMKDVVPFGPFLVIGATLTFFFGYQIINAYFQLFNLL